MFYQEYLNIILEIPHEHFEEDVGRVQMQLRFKGMRKGGGDMKGGRTRREGGHEGRKYRSQ